MVFDLGVTKVRTTVLPFNRFVLEERRKERADILLMSFNTFPEISLEAELEGRTDRIQRIVQLSQDDRNTVFCGIETEAYGFKHIGAAVAHKGKLYDIADRTINLGADDFGETDAIKIYNTSAGKIALLIDTDATLEYLWEKVSMADFVLCIVKDEAALSDIAKLAGQRHQPAVVLSSESGHFLIN